MTKSALIATAFSGGHIFPALAVADSLKKTFSFETIFITTGGGFKQQIEKKGHKVFCFGRRGVCSLLIKLPLDIVHSFFIIKKYKPSIFIGFGGAVSIGPFIAARLSGIPILIHEQNARFGRANRLLSRFSHKIALGFLQEATQAASNKLVLTGNPIREEFLQVREDEARAYFGFSSDLPTILVVGGSQGSRMINIKFLKAIELLKKIPFNVIHITGSSDYDFVCAQYRNLDIKYKVFRFLEDMHLAYKISSLVISRAGAMTLSEISLFAIPVILIPYPYSRGHQNENASLFRERNAALVIKEEELSEQRLAEEIRHILTNPEDKKRMGENARKFARPSATDDLVGEIKRLVNV